ncbi:hypothetical protein B0H13DRAFT_2316392 [Mycena leptocephala]|nr:hypothetical protein B0H13DRAFT_2316392 [Mycena leptocephala]
MGLVLEPIVQFDLLFAIEALVGTVFGAIHCAAWNTDFPTAVEMWIWRACSLLIVAIPIIILLLSILVGFTDVDESQWIGKVMLAIGFYVPIPIYVIARLVLILVPLIGLRFLPSGAFMDVNRSMYILHL